ncbi:MAG: thiamine phosphate synthase [Rickettsiales bacterium]|nr:thiamine phosphate synthase [Rickettsiales bacterium]
MTKIYLISPPKIELNSFRTKLEESLKTNLIPVFQLRLKDYPQLEIKKIAQELRKVCRDNNCSIIINDSYEIALEAGADGVHVGVEDGLIKNIYQKTKKINPNFIIGASCYDSKHLAMEAGEQGADYISFGAFFESKTKKSRGNPTIEILKWCDEIINLPIVAIGGITDQNCSSLVKSGADFLAVISYIWDNPLGITNAVKNLDSAILKNLKS